MSSLTESSALKRFPNVRSASSQASSQQEANASQARANASQAMKAPVQDGVETEDTRDSCLCVHCQLPVPLHRQEEDGPSFCCQGCETVFGLLETLGETFPDFSPPTRETDVEVGPGVGQGKTQSIQRYEEWDRPAWLSRFSRDLGQGLSEITLAVEGIHCSACLWLLEKLPSFVEGVLSSKVDAGRLRLTVVWERERTSLSQIAYFLHRMGYPVELVGLREDSGVQRRFERKSLIRIAVAGALAGNIMMIAFALYGGMFWHMEEEYRQFFRWMSLVLATPAVFWAGWPFFQRTYIALRTRVMHMDIPIALGISVGYGSGVWNTFRGSGEIYFDSVATLIFLLLIGRWLQYRQQRKAQEATEQLYFLTPPTARLWEGEVAQEVSVEELVEGDILEVLPGEVFAVDGVVLEGCTQVDCALLTGESLPVECIQGAEVHAGTLNVSSRVLVEAKQTGLQTRIHRIMEEVKEARQLRAPIELTADALVGKFLFVVFALACVTLAVWWVQSPKEALDHTIALLVVTCPCALGMATPLAMTAALGRAARHGILVKGGQALEALSRPGLLWLDKTGTLTQGRLSLVGWHGERDVQTFVQAIESASSHPIAKALQRDLPSASEKPMFQVEQIHGAGVIGRGDLGVFCVGSPTFVQEHCGAFPDWVAPIIQTWTARAWTPVLVARDEQVVAAAALGDPLREEAAEVLDALRRAGWEIGILSGDSPAVVDVLGERLGIPTALRCGGRTPEQKLSVIQNSLQTHEQVVMVGDGVNDTSALAAAHVGIGVHGGAEACLATADVFFAKPGLAPLQRLISGAKKTQRVVRLNLWFSFFYNAIGVSLAMMGLLNPLWAAILMPFSSLTVVTLSFRARTFGDS